MSTSTAAPAAGEIIEEQVHAHRLTDKEWADKVQARRQKWEAMKAEMNQPRLQEMRNMEKYAMVQPKVKAAFERHATAVTLLKSIEASGSDDIFVRSLYANSAMVDRPRHVGLPDRDTILRKNIYYLSHAVEYAKDLIIQLVQNGFINIYDKDEIDQYQDALLQCVALFVLLFKKQLNVNLLSKLVGVLYLTGNTAAADIIMEAKRLAEHADAVAVPVVTSPPPVKPRRNRDRETETNQAAAAKGEEWSCMSCTYLNDVLSGVCEMCSKSKDFMEAHANSSQECPLCTFINPPRQVRCNMCEFDLVGSKKGEEDEESDEDEEGWNKHPVNFVDADW